MSEQDRGTDRVGRRCKLFLAPQQKYELFLRFVRGEATIAEAADQAGIDRTTVMKLRTVAKQGTLDVLAASRPVVCRKGVDRSSSRPGPRSSDRQRRPPS